MARDVGTTRARPVPRLLVAAVLMATAAASCGGDGGGGDGGESSATTAPEASEASGEREAFTVETLSETFVDESRPTDDPAGVRAAPTRTLVTDIYVPDGEGPFPLIVHAHGFNGNPGKFTELLTRWAEAGYVVAAPKFPMTNDLDGGTGVLGDYVNQPADVTLVIDEVLRLAAGDHPALAGRVDEERIGVSGHSLGGATAYGLVFNDCCRDDRVGAVAIMSSVPAPFEGGSYRFTGVPLLLLQLTEDPIIPYEEAEGVYEQATRPRFLLTLDGGTHFEPYEDVPSPFDGVVRDVTVAFWDAYLGANAAAVDRLVDAGESGDQTRLAADP
jgi:dienelactone hydrolase